MQKKHNGLGNSGRWLRENRRHHNDFYDLQRLREERQLLPYKRERRGPHLIQEDGPWLTKQSAV